jgi:subtilase family serine protease
LLIPLALALLLASPAGAATRSPKLPPASSAPSTARLRLVLPLVADDSGLAHFAASVTNPASPEYGRYASIRWLAKRFGASPSAERTAVEFLRAHGATAVRVDATGLFVDALMPRAIAERLFAVSLREVHAGRLAYAVPRALPSLPSPLQGVVTGVVGLDTRPLLLGTGASRSALSHAAGRSGPPGASSGARSTAAAQTAQPGSGYEPASGYPDGCLQARATGGFTPGQFLDAYDYAPLHAEGLRGQGERVALIEVDGFKISDIDTFAACFGLHVPQIDAFGVGIRHPLAPGAEATLDLEVLDAAAPRLSQIDVYETAAEASDVLLTLTAPLQSRGLRPDVMSASLGLCEPQLEAAVGRAGIDAAEAALQEAAAAGISFVAAAGDDGSSGCTDQFGDPLPRLAVDYPASSPWATSVGGTNLHLQAGTNRIISSQVWNDTDQIPGELAAGGGGFSSLFTRPAYQNGTVAADRRAVPDVALLSDIAPGYAIYCSVNSGDGDTCLQPGLGIQCPATDGTGNCAWQPVGGTSAATPLLAGGLALVDQDLREHGRQPLGLVNPLLYEIGKDPAQAAAVFQDVTIGNNDIGPWIGSGTTLPCCSAGPGFDEASGWGGVDLSALAAVALARQPQVARVSVSLPAQRPLRTGRLLSRAYCSARCAVVIRVVLRAGDYHFTDTSSRALLNRAGSVLLIIRFSPAQLRLLRQAADRRRRIAATVTAAITDPGGAVEARSAAALLRISG